MGTNKYEGKPFAVTIRRDTAERRYVLTTIEKDGTLKPQNEPLYRKEFEKHYKFSPVYPHEKIKIK